MKTKNSFTGNKHYISAKLFTDCTTFSLFCIHTILTKALLFHVDRVKRSQEIFLKIILVQFKIKSFWILIVLPVTQLSLIFYLSKSHKTVKIFLPEG